MLYFFHSDTRHHWSDGEQQMFGYCHVALSVSVVSASIGFAVVACKLTSETFMLHLHFCKKKRYFSSNKDHKIVSLFHKFSAFKAAVGDHFMGKIHPPCEICKKRNACSQFLQNNFSAFSIIIQYYYYFTF